MQGSGLIPHPLICIRGDFPCSGHPVKVSIRSMAHLSSVIPANDTRESVFGTEIFLAMSGD